jgi:predicted XRE-type DNA-binding protein
MIKTSQVKQGSENIFSDLGFADANERLAKAKLAHAICLIIESQHLTQAKAAARLGIDQPKVSALVRGQLDGFSTDRLFRFLNALGHDVQVTLRPAKHGLGALSVMNN